MNDSFDVSFALLSSMSPKVDKNSGTKKKKKVTSILALKKSLRRSSIYDKLPQTKPNQIHIESASSSSINASSSNNTKASSQSIVIPASDESGNEYEDAVQSQHLSSTKFNSIKQWVLDIDTEPDRNDSLYSRISSIDGRDLPDLFPPANSTFINGIQPVGINEMFKSDNFVGLKNNRKLVEITELKNNEIDKGENRKADVLVKKEIVDEIKKKFEDEVFIIEDSSDDDEVKKARNISQEKKNNDVCNKFAEKDFNTPKNQRNKMTEEDEENYTKMLDEVYGKGWRLYKENVLPASEPKLRKQKSQFKRPQDAPQTEIKPKSKTLIKKTEPDRKKSQSKLLPKSKAQQSPWLAKLKTLCDSDTESDSNSKDDLRVKLNFEESPYFSRKNYRWRQTSRSSSSSSSLENINDEVGKKIWSSSSSSVNGSDDFVYNDVPLEERLKKNFNDKRKLFLPTESDKPKKKNEKLLKTPAYKPVSFLASLSPHIPITQADPSARIFRNGYKSYKEELLVRLFKMFNEQIFDNCMAEDTQFEWSDRLTGTAAYCACKKITHRNGNIDRKARFVLSAKVLDSPDRLRDTLVHEMCHAATWIVNQVSDGHGKYWKAWADKAMRTFPELPPIKRCHDYAIKTKFTYRCTKCGYSIGRHTKSLDIERKCCGYCHGRFEILINKKSKGGETKTMPATLKKEPSAFALFVKENYANYKNPNSKHGDVMKLLGMKFKEMKVAK